MHDLIFKLDKKQAEVMMFQKPLNRVLFYTTNPKETGTHWIRVRTGDIGTDGFTKTTIDYKSVINIEDDRREIAHEMIVTDYDNAIEFMKATGAQKASTQQNLRTKIRYKHGDHNFVLCLDCWPWLEDSLILKGEAHNKHGVDHLEDFLSFLGLSDADLATNLKEFHGGLDGVYATKLGFNLMDVRHVSFDIPAPKFDPNLGVFIEYSGNEVISKKP